MNQSIFNIYFTEYEVVLHVQSEEKTGYITLTPHAFKALYKKLEKTIDNYEEQNGTILFDAEYFKKFQDKGQYVKGVMQNIYKTKKVSPNLFVTGKKKKK